MRYLFILGSVFLGAFAQFFFKTGMNSLKLIGRIEFKSLIQIFLNKYIIIGLLLYSLSVVVWFVVLSKFELSYAYPFVSLGYVVTLLMGYFLLNETMSMNKAAGIIIICIGVIVLSRSKG